MTDDAAKDFDGHASEQDVRAGVGVGDRYRDPDGHAALTAETTHAYPCPRCNRLISQGSEVYLIVADWVCWVCEECTSLVVTNCGLCVDLADLEQSAEPCQTCLRQTWVAA